MPYAGSYIWKIRQKIEHDPLIMPSADAVAVRDDGRLLVIFNKDHQNWFFPGGYVEEGQTSNECAARELLEEASIEADPSALIPFAFSSGHKVHYPNGDTTFPFTQLFIARKWRDTGETLDEEEVSLELLKYLSLNYLELLAGRYKLDYELDELATWREEQWLEAIARKRGTILSGGRIDYQKAAEIVLTDFRDGQIGNITLELPTEWTKWLAAARIYEAQLREDRAQRQLDRKK